ncbi:MAG: integrase [Myxococcota bacterium]|jgi:integrase
MPKSNKKLTEIVIRNAKPKDKKSYLFDDGGLRLLIRPTGTKVWQYPYRLNGKNNIYTIGKYGQDEGFITTANARKIRDEIKDLITHGLDPNKNKKSKKQAALAKAENTFESIAEEWRSKQEWTAKHSKNIQSRLEKDVYPIIGWKSIKEVTIQDILQILRHIEERGAVTVAQRINGYCTEIFDYALVMGVCESNPALGRAKFLKTHTITNRPHLSNKELPDFMRNLNASSEENLVLLSIKLLVMTLQRPGEVRGARWEEFNEKEANWSIPAIRMKMKREHVVSLPKQSLDLIKKIHSISGNTPFLFPGRYGSKNPISDVAMIKVMRKLSNNKMTPHGIRHTGSTILNENNFNSDWIERQLSHVEENKVRGTYNKAEYLEQRRDMMQWWVDYLDKIGGLNG